MTDLTALLDRNQSWMARLANPAIQQQAADRLGLTVDEVAAMAITYERAGRYRAAPRNTRDT